jgi:hypothetical protein
MSPKTVVISAAMAIDGSSAPSIPWPRARHPVVPFPRARGSAA